MKPKISSGQLTILMANFIFSASLISLPQILVRSSGHNSWLFVLGTFPVILLFILLIVGKNKNVKHLAKFLKPGEKHTFLEKAFYILFFLFMGLIFLRDLRSFVDFIAAVLLPNTPLDVLIILSTLVILYVVSSGLEVIARVSVIQFGFLAVIVLALPLTLLNEFEPGNFQPILGMEALPGFLKSVYIFLGWVGEVIFIATIIADVAPEKDIRKAAIKGTVIIYILFFTLLGSEIGVLGEKIIEVSIYPSHQLIQQINLTDFLDRLDVFIVVIWLPNIFTKLALAFYCMNKVLSCFVKKDTNVYLLPVSLVFSQLAILLFKNNVNQLEFSYYTWPTLGLALEILLLGLYMLIKWNLRRQNENKSS